MSHLCTISLGNAVFMYHFFRKWTISLENVPLQKWSNLIISVNDRNMELYLDGKLVKTCILSGVPEQATDSMVHITPGSTKDPNKFGFGGFVSNFRHIGKAVNPREAWKIYKNGYEQGGMFSNIFKFYICN